MDTESIIKGYISGFFDGEGSVSILKDKRCNYYGLRTSISQANYDVLNRILSKTGGSIVPDKRRKKKNGELGKQKWILYATADNAFRVLKYIQSYSVVKRRQIDLGIKFFDEIKDYSGYNKGIPQIEIQKREWFANKMKKLNHEKYDEKVLQCYDNEIKKLSIDKDIRDGKQLTLLGLDELYKIKGIKENNETKEDQIVNMSDDVFIGYCAGFFDAEGCVLITRGYNLKAFIKQTSYDILKMICDKYGGIVDKIKKMKKTDIGNDRKQQWEWRISSDSSVPFLKAIYPYTILKQEQIGLCIEYQTLSKVKYNPKFGRNPLSTDEKNKREHYRIKLIELKKQSGEEMEEYDDNTYEYDIINKKTSGIRILSDF